MAQEAGASTVPFYQDSVSLVRVFVFFILFVVRILIRF